MDEDVDALADAVEYWKQARFHFGQLLRLFVDGDVDREAFRDEFVDTHLDAALLDLLEEVADDFQDADGSPGTTS